MIQFEEALDLMEDYLERLSSRIGINLAVVDDGVIEREFGWVFFYDSSEYLESGVFSEKLAGNAPVIIDRRDSSLHETGTAFSVEVYIDNYERFSSPNP